jgi:hypothetical protein
MIGHESSPFGGFMSWALFNPFQKCFCVISLVILISQGFVIYSQQYSKEQVSLSCPKIPPYPRPQKIDLSSLSGLRSQIDNVLKENKKLQKLMKDQRKLDKIVKNQGKLDKIVKNQRKIDLIIQRLDTWGIER